MMRRGWRPVLMLVSLLVVLGVWFAPPFSPSSTLAGQAAATGQPSTRNGEWPHYNGDLRGSRYSPLDQINASNFSKLEVAWRFKTDSLRAVPRIQARRHAADGQGRALHDGRHAPVGHRARREDRRADLVAQPARRQARRRRRRASCRAAASRTGPTARATSASST